VPPLLALALCLAFIFFLLRLEAKQSPDVSKVIWIPTIWMLSAASKPLAAWFRASGADPDSGSPIDRAFLIVLIFIALLVLLKRRFDWSSAIKDNSWLMILIIFMLISVLWSGIPGISFKRWAREFLAVLMAFIVLSESRPRHAMESILRRTAYILIPLSPLLIKYFPQYGVQYNRWSGARMWVGVAMQKNGLGRLCMVAAFFLIWSLIRRWQGNNPGVWKYQTHIEIIVLAITLWLITGGAKTSATSLIALAMGLISYITFYFMKKAGKTIGAGLLMLVVAFMIIYGTTSVFTGQMKFGFIANVAGRDETLTGRTEIWARLLPVAMQKPIFGGGFGGFWTPATRETFRISGSHNGYLDVLIGLGFVGLVLTSIFLLSSCRRAHQVIDVDFDWGALWIGFIIMAVAHNVAESSISSFANQLSAILLFFSITAKNILYSTKQSNSAQ
jgi:exopolysaccharide production protein ExoQ